MAGWLNVLWDAWSAGWNIGKALAGSDTQNQLANVFHALSSSVNYQNQWNNAVFPALVRLAQVFNRPHRVYTGWPGYAAQAGNTINSAFRALTDQIIPATAYDVLRRAYAQDRSAGGSLGRLWARVYRDEKQLYAVRGSVYNYDHPHIVQWLQFKAYWDKWLAKPSQQLQHWSEHPYLLSNLLAKSMVPAINGFLNGPGGRQPADRLLATLLRFAPDDVQQIDQAAVAVLNSGNY